MAACEVILVRHGQSEDFAEGVSFPLADGHGDPPLSAAGREQARHVGTWLATAGLDAIYVTSLRRTVQTAAPLAQRLGLDLVVEPELREVYLGEWEGGLYRKMIADGHPAAARVFAEGRWEAIPGAESSAAFGARVGAALERLVDAHPDGRVAVFTHGGVIGQAIAIATGARPFSFMSASSASISRLVAFDGHSDRHWVVLSFNDTSHLAADFGPAAA